MEDYVMKPPPELIVKFWPPSVTAKGVQAIDAIKRPLAFLVYARVVMAIIFGLVLLWQGHEYGGWALRHFRMLIGL
jgi:hypothetical protein